MSSIKALSLDEAIKHCLEVAEENEELSSKFDEWDDWEKADADNCRRCAADHRQLAEWLTELKELRNSIGAVKLKDMKEAVGLLQELNAENDQLTSQLVDAKRLLKLAVEDMHIEDMCDVCVKRIPNSPIHCPDSSNCFVWRYKDEAEKLIES